MRSDKHTKKKKKWIKYLIITFSILFIGLAAYLFTVYSSLNAALSSMQADSDRTLSPKRTDEIAFSKQEPFSVLLLGVDEREGDKGRSDTMIVLTVNPKVNSVKMLSIPRDTYTEIIGHGTTDKINHAYAFGGVDMSLDTVENFLDIPIDYFVQINMEGFRDIVDAVGGVTVENDLDFSYEGFNFPVGTLNLNGEEALAYSRMRKEDPRGDFGRQLRQRQVIEGVINEGASVSSLWNFQNIFEALGNNVKTNITFSEMVDVQKNYREATNSVEQISFTKGQGQTIGGVWYLVIPDEEVIAVQDELKTHLDLNE
ncbi:LytR family transcriptional regulator [Bacillus spongiae]|uniref:Polyisoprenyl-teichoic acid--peptidoglycan teichoic acid transferase TagU n=1 Tax=Bacillus spongiae TaxID=2683610 RepID=A0ABU8HEL0_9BACI